jgi:tetratricopeptide (TPR) repeat protein
MPAMPKNESLIPPEFRIQVRGMHMNKSLCYTKIEAWDKGLQAVNKALEFGGDEGKVRFDKNLRIEITRFLTHIISKCLYRRGLCSLKLGDLDRARSDLEKALSLAPGDANIAKQLKVKFDTYLRQPLTAVYTTIPVD